MRVGSSTVARARSGARGGWRGFVFVFAWDRSVRVLTCLEHLQHAAWKLALHAPHLARVRASLRFDTPPRDTSGGCGFEPRCRSFQIFGTALTELNCLASRCESFSSLSAHPRWRGAVAAGGDARCEANLLLGRSVDMGLFGDLPSAKDGSSRGDGGRSSETPTGGRSDGVAATTTPGSTAGKTGGWSGAGSALRAPPRKSPALLNPQMLKAQAAALRAQQAKLARQKEATSTDGPGGSSAARTPGTRPSASATPVVVRKTGIGGGDVPEPSAATYGTLSAEVDDEYTPGQPNSYEDVVRLRTRRAATEAAARERERQRVELERQRHELEEERRAAAAAAGTAPDRSSLNVTGEEAHTRRATLTFVKPGSRLHAQGSRLHAQGAAVLAGEAEMKPEMKPEPQKPAAPVKDKGMSLAQKMMEKMGWKEGSGLGKDGQGMTTPLMAQKDGIRSGVIVNAPEMFPNRSTVIGDAPAEGEGAHTGEGARLGAPAFVSSSDALVAVVPAAGEEERFAAPTRVLLLRNLTGPGEVDGDLEDEVAEECERFGAVVRVVIFEVTDAGFPAREAVRIFTEFVEDASAERCRAEMDGRFFGGRTVRATFYDEDKFFANDLGPQPGEKAVGL